MERAKPPPPPPSSVAIRPKSVSVLEEEFPNLSLYQRERRPSANAILQSTGTSPPALSPGSFAYGAGGLIEEVTTIHVAGLPEDITEREFVNMFMFAPGFETAVLRYNHNPAAVTQLIIVSSEEEEEKVGSPFSLGLPPLIKSAAAQDNAIPATLVVGFARFQTRQDALDARDHLNGKFVDVERKVMIRVELARKNLLMPLLSQGSYSIPISKNDLMVQQQQAMLPRRQSFAGSIPPGGEYGSVFSPYEMYSPLESMINSPIGSGFPVPRPQLPPQVSSNGGRHSISAKLVATTAAYPGVPPALIVGENPPCNTLYVGNLPVTATEEELWVLFSPCRGFKRLSFRLKPNGPMCFVEFEDIACATEAMETLYGTMLSCSVKGGIRLSYSKNPLGVRASVPQTPVQYSTASMVLTAAGGEEDSPYSSSVISSVAESPLHVSTSSVPATFNMSQPNTNS